MAKMKRYSPPGSGQWSAVRSLGDGYTVSTPMMSAIGRDKNATVEQLAAEYTADNPYEKEPPTRFAWEEWVGTRRSKFSSCGWITTLVKLKELVLDGGEWRTAERAAEGGAA